MESEIVKTGISLDSDELFLKEDGDVVNISISLHTPLTVRKSFLIVIIKQTGCGVEIPGTFWNNSRILN